MMHRSLLVPFAVCLACARTPVPDAATTLPSTAPPSAAAPSGPLLAAADASVVAPAPDAPSAAAGVADAPLEQPLDATPAGHAVEANLQRAAVVRAGRDRVWTRALLVAERNRYRNELAGDKSQMLAAGEREKKRTRVDV